MNPARPNRLWLALVTVVTTLVAMVGWPVYLVLLATRPKYRAHWPERWGFVPRFAPGRTRLWVHAISVGEVMATRTFIPALREAFPEAEVVLSTTTLTGRRRARQLYPDLPVFHWPLDLWPAVGLALARVKPTAVIQVESEWWPTFFLTAARRGIPLLVVNLRLTERGLMGYRRIRPLIRATMNTCAAIGVQAALYTDRLLRLGVDPERIHDTGQMKLDGVTFTDTVPGAEALREAVGIDPDAPVLVAGSTGPGEEPLLVDAFREIRKWHPRTRLVVVPRRPETFDTAAEAFLRADVGLLRRSSGEWLGPKRLAPVVLGDTMGELMAWYALADVVIVGRSFVPLGGSNPTEPASLGKPLVWGPAMFNFPVEAPAFEAAGAAVRVETAEALAREVDALLTDADRRRAMADAARACIRRLQGATAKNVALVRRVLSEEGAP